MFTSKLTKGSFGQSRTSFKRLVRYASTASSSSGSNCDYTVNEIKIPTSDGHLAGKLWEGKPSSPSSSSKQNSSPIICTHGYLDNAGSFDHLIPFLIKPNQKFFALDFPGHGFSSHSLRPDYSLFIDGYLAVHRVIRHYGWDKITLLAHSLGAAVSYIFAGIFPEQVDRFIALDNFHPVPRGLQWSIKDQITGLFAAESILEKKLPPPTYSYEEIVQKLYDARFGTIDLAGCQTLLKRGASQSPEFPEKFAFTHDIRCSRSPGIWRFSKEQDDFIGAGIKCPVCVIKANDKTGRDAETLEVFMESVEKIRSNTSRLEFHLIEGTHHFHLNDPQSVAPIINKFLESSS